MPLRTSRRVEDPTDQGYTPIPQAGAGLTELQERINVLDAKDKEVEGVLRAIDATFASRRSPFLEEKNDIVQEREALRTELARKSAPHQYPPAVGPPELAFVDKLWFSAVCNVVVVLNIACMALASKLQAYQKILFVFDQLFLLWYVFELTAKWQYHRANLFFGSISVVWWNWMDAGIVVGGVIDQWLLGPLPVQLSGMSDWLKFLRLFRVMRVLKVLKSFMQGDLSWTDQAPFQLFMSGIIAVNSVVMSLELDYEWELWYWFEQAFLIIYTFELAVRLRVFGCKFFVNSDLVWNNLDFFMVCGGVFNLWVMPGWSLIQSMLHGKSVEGSGNDSIHNMLKILKMAKILRVLRLVRLLKMVKPLYELLVGVMESLHSMKWVLILTILVLYAGAIVFTSLIGHGYIYSSASDVPPEAEIYFGSVPQSVFSLFKLMNGDTSVVEPICQDIKGRLLFAGFMIVSNWSVLAILTSVVSDNMLSSSQRLLEEDREAKREEKFDARQRLLQNFFANTDLDKNGKVTKPEWVAMLGDPANKQQLRDLTGYDDVTLHEMFFILSENEKRSKHNTVDFALPEKAYLRLDNFIEHLNHDRDAADRRQILHLRYWIEKTTLNRFQKIEDNLAESFKELRAMLETALPSSISKDLRIEKGLNNLRQPAASREEGRTMNLSGLDDNRQNTFREHALGPEPFHIRDGLRDDRTPIFHQRSTAKRWSTGNLPVDFGLQRYDI